MGRAPCCDKANVKRGPWSPEEDAKLKSYIEQHGTGGNWIALPQKIGLKRCGKSCRLRWLNYLRPDIKHGGFSEEEDSIICSLYVSIGSRWSVIAAQLPGRTDNDVKNYWNTKLKKKLLQGGRPPKDLQHVRRRAAAGSPKPEAEIKDAEKGRCMAAVDDSSRWASYWPQPQVPTYDPNQDRPSTTAADPSVGQLPVSQSGRFPGASSSQLYVSCHSSLDDLIPPPCTSGDSFKSRTSPFPPGGHILQGAGGCCSLMPELEEIFCCNPERVLEGLDGFCGVDNMDMISESSRTTASSESLSWEEMSPYLVCPPLISGYHQPMHPPQQQPLLEEQLQPRMR